MMVSKNLDEFEKNGLRAKKLHFWPKNLHLGHKVKIQKTLFLENPSMPNFKFFVVTLDIML